MSNTTLNPQVAYFKFTNIIKQLMGMGKHCSIITFNYDLGLDYYLQYNKIPFDYSLNEAGVAKKAGVSYLKLHGSINWGSCSGEHCKEITFPSELRRETQENYSIVPIISKLKDAKCVCGEPIDEDPFIVPPTWNKTAFDEQIEQVWKRAASELNDAEHIFVLGYSLPSTDLFFNYLFALGVDMRTILKGFYVRNIDPIVEERFESLLGSGIDQRFEFRGNRFEDFVDNDPVIHRIFNSK